MELTANWVLGALRLIVCHLNERETERGGQHVWRVHHVAGQHWALPADGAVTRR